MENTKVNTQVSLSTAVALLARFHSAFAAVRYVDVNSTNAAPP